MEKILIVFAFMGALVFAEAPPTMTETQAKDGLILQRDQQITALMRENADLRKQIADLRDQAESARQIAFVKEVCAIAKIAPGECASVNPQTKEISLNPPVSTEKGK